MGAYLFAIAPPDGFNKGILVHSVVDCLPYPNIAQRLVCIVHGHKLKPIAWQSLNCIILIPLELAYQISGNENDVHLPIFKGCHLGGVLAHDDKLYPVDVALAIVVGISLQNYFLLRDPGREHIGPASNWSSPESIGSLHINNCGPGIGKEGESRNIES